MNFGKVISILIFLILAIYLMLPDINNFVENNLKNPSAKKELNVTKQLLENEYKTRHIEASKKEIEEYKKELINILGSKEALNEKCKESEIDEYQLEVIISEQIKQDKLLKSLGLKEIKNSETEKFYKENKKLFELPERFQISYLLIKEKNEFLTKEIKNKININNFKQIAQKYSKEKDDIVLYNDFKYVSKNDIPAEMYVQISKQKIETISPAIKSSQGIYFVYLKDKSAPKTISYEEAKEDIKQFLYKKEKEKLMERFLKGKLSKEKLQTFSQSLEGILK